MSETRLPPVAGPGRRLLLALLVINGFGQVAAGVVAALVVEHAFSALLVPAAEPPTTATVVAMGAALVTAAALSGWLRMRERADAERLGQRYVHDLRVLLFAHLAASSSRRLQRRSQGSTMLRFLGDLGSLRKWVSLGLARLVVGGVMVSGVLVALAVLAPLLAGLVASTVAVGVAVSVVLSGKMQLAAREAHRRRSRLAANVTEKLGAMAVVQAFGQTEAEQARVDRQSRRLRRAMIDRARHAGRLRGIAEATGGMATAVVLIAGVSGRATTGTVAAAMTIVGLMVLPLRDLGRVQEYWRDAEVARAKIDSLLASPTGLTEAAGAQALEPGPGQLAFEHLCLEGALDSFSATAQPGQVVAIVGPNGAGKTTLLSVAARLLEPDGGRVLLDGRDLAHHAAVDVRRCLGLVGPDLPLLRGTIARNLIYRLPDAPLEEIERVALICGVGEVLDALPEGIETRIAEGGAGLSAGQRQRLALARALLGNPSVLLLDEADANLDSEASAVVDRVLDAHHGTVLVVTHRRERLASADVVWHLREGRLVEQGDPAQLLAADGPTAQLFGTHLRAAG